MIEKHDIAWELVPLKVGVSQLLFNSGEKILAAIIFVGAVVDLVAQLCRWLLKRSAS